MTFQETHSSEKMIYPGDKKIISFNLLVFVCNVQRNRLLRKQFLLCGKQFHSGLGLCINHPLFFSITVVSNSAQLHVIRWVSLAWYKGHGPRPRFEHLGILSQALQCLLVILLWETLFVPLHGWENRTWFVREWWVVLNGQLNIRLLLVKKNCSLWRKEYSKCILYHFITIMAESWMDAKTSDCKNLVRRTFT